MRKSVLMALGMTLISGSVAFSGDSLIWGETTGSVKDYLGADLPMSKTDGTIGAFAQLIWAGADNTPDAFSASGTGVTDDDKVVDVTYSYGYNSFLAASNKFYFATSHVGASDSGVYYVRVYNAGNPNYYTGDTNASIPAAATYYWQSSTYTFTWAAGGGVDSFSFTGGANVTMTQPIPEPASLALLALGALTILGRRTLRKK